jgi:hypothetical protein
VAVVMPIIYALLFMFGSAAFVFPLNVFKTVVGEEFGEWWAIGIALSSLVSLVGLIFKLRIEIYSSIVLTILLAIYPVYLGYVVYLDFQDPDPKNDLGRFASIFSVAIYCVMPAWRVFDIVLEIRKVSKRQLYAKATLGG